VKKDNFSHNLKRGVLAFFVVGSVLFPSITYAHCPLCTAGAGILAIIAASLGVPALIISTLLGGFALAMGLWLAKLIEKKYFNYQDYFVAGVIYLSTVLPLWPVLKEYKILYAPFLGFDKYADKVPVDVYITGVVLGALILAISPYISKKLSTLASKQLIPFQGILITMVLLVIVPLIINAFLLI